MDVDFLCIESIIEHYYEALYRYSYRMLRSKEDAEDIVQEVFISINNLLEEKKDIVLHNNYLYKTTYNKCLNKIKRDKLIGFISFEKYKAAHTHYEKDIYFKYELSEELSKIMSMLKTEERSLLILRGVVDMSYDEISSIMGKSSVTLRKQYERIRKKVMRSLDKKEGAFDVKDSFI